MPFARDVYTATAAQTDFDITYSYISQEHVEVFQNGTQLTLGASADFIYLDADTVQLNTGATLDDTIVLQRNSSQSSILVDFTAGTLTENDLDTSALQAFYMAQEALDQIATAMVKDSSENFDALSARIKNVATPTADTDAATKSYVDTQFGNAATTAVPISQGGTGATTAAGARSNLGISAITAYGELYVAGNTTAQTVTNTQATLDFNAGSSAAESEASGVTIVPADSSITVTEGGIWWIQVFLSCNSGHSQTVDNTQEFFFELQINGADPVGRIVTCSVDIGDSATTNYTFQAGFQAMMQLTAADVLTVEVSEANTESSMDITLQDASFMVMRIADSP